MRFHAISRHCSTPPVHVEAECSSTTQPQLASTPRDSPGSPSQPEEGRHGDAEGGSVGDDEAGLALAERVDVRRQRGHEAPEHVVAGLAAGDRVDLAGEEGGVLVGELLGVLLRGQPGAVRADVELAQPRVADGLEAALGGDRVGRLRRAGEVGGPDRDRRERGHERRDLLGLRQPDVVERDVGVALGPPGVVPGGAPVAQEDQAPHVSVSGMTGQSLQSRSRA